jgi:hypothetical protein
MVAVGRFTTPAPSLSEPIAAELGAAKKTIKVRSPLPAQLLNR